MDIQPFEFVGAKKLYEEGRFLLADEMGMFKTAQAIFANNKVRKGHKKTRTLVVCPNSVKEHWEREIGKWGYPRGQDVNVIDARNFDSAIKRAKDADWTILSYPLASTMSKERSDYLSKADFHHVILDEVHNSKNPEACRTRLVKTLSDSAEYLSMLSGTPIPNTVEDIYMLMSLLEPDKYPLHIRDGNGNVVKDARRRFLDLYMQNPQVVKDLLHRKMLRREISNYMGSKVPKLVEDLYEIELKGQQLDIYNEILEQQLAPGEKIIQLQKALLNPNIVNKNLIKDGAILGQLASQKYEALDGIVEKEAGKGKVLVFTNLKEGIVGDLLERYSKYGAVAITGDIPADSHGKREYLRERFQKDKDCRMLIATTTMNEGVDLTAATAVVDLTIPWTPAERLQRVKRSQRIGEVEKEETKRYTLLGALPLFKSLDQAMLEMLEGKEKTIGYILSGIRVSRDELLELQEPQKTPVIRRAIKSPNQTIFGYYVNWRGIGTESALRKINRKDSASPMIAELYPHFSMAYSSARLYVPLVEEGNQYPVLDLAGGPGMFSYFSKQPSTLVDIDMNMLKKSKELSPQTQPVNAPMSSIPLPDQTFGSVVCSLAYQMAEPTKERAKTLKEMNRVLKEGGYAVIVMPGNYFSNEDREKFDAALHTYGFNKVYEARNQSPSKLDVYHLKKVGNASDTTLDLTFKGDVYEKKI